MDWYGESEFAELLGKTISSIEGASGGSEDIYITLSDGTQYHMYHQQDCCEHVSVEDVAGDVSDLLDSPLTMAEVSSSGENPEGTDLEYQESFTWTYYRLATVKGYVTVRWYGSSNGYYSERVTFEKM